MQPVIDRPAKFDLWTADSEEILRLEDAATLARSIIAVDIETCNYEGDRFETRLYLTNGNYINVEFKCQTEAVNNSKRYAMLLRDGLIKVLWASRGGTIAEYESLGDLPVPADNFVQEVWESLGINERVVLRCFVERPGSLSDPLSDFELTQATKTKDWREVQAGVAAARTRGLLYIEPCGDNPIGQQLLLTGFGRCIANFGRALQ